MARDDNTQKWLYHIRRHDCGNDNVGRCTQNEHGDDNGTEDHRNDDGRVDVRRDGGDDDGRGLRYVPLLSESM